MARDRGAEYERRNERARAKGFTSYAQQRAARAIGYEEPSVYRTAVRARAARAGVVRGVASGKLLGGQQTRTGTVIGAHGNLLPSLAATVARFGPDKRVRVDVELPDGQVLHLAQHGGVKYSSIVDAGGLAEWAAMIARRAYGNLTWTMPDDDDEEPDEDDDEELDDEEADDLADAIRHGDAIVTVTIA